MDTLYKIGEVAYMCDTTIKTIRYYEKTKLISPIKVDENNGYRYFNMETISFIQQIQKLKNLGFTLAEIKMFINMNVDDKFKFVVEKEQQFEKTKKNLFKLLSQTVRQINITFINDKKAVGKWRCIGVSKSIQDYHLNSLLNIQPYCKNLYFLKNGAGYGLIDGWSNGKIYYALEKNTWTYTIKGKLMFVQTLNNVHIFEKEDSLIRTTPDQDYIDNTAHNFKNDPNAIGLWTIYDHVHKLDIDSYQPKGKSLEKYFIKSISFLPNGFCIIDENSLYHKKWTKDFIIDKKEKITMPYKIISHNNKQFLLLTWKDDYYKYFGQTTWSYVFEKQ